MSIGDKKMSCSAMKGKIMRSGVYKDSQRFTISEVMRIVATRQVKEKDVNKKQVRQALRELCAEDKLVQLADGAWQSNNLRSVLLRQNWRPRSNEILGIQPARVYGR